MHKYPLSFRIKVGANVQIEGRAAFGASLSNAELGFMLGRTRLIHPHEQ